MRLLTLLGMFGLVGSGCGPELQVSLVDPSEVTAGQENTIRVRGAGFKWDYNGFTDTLQGTFSVTVGEAVFDDPVWIDATQLEITLPTDFAPGLYDVTVDSHRGSDTAEASLVVQPAPATSSSAQGFAGGR